LVIAVREERKLGGDRIMRSIMWTYYQILLGLLQETGEWLCM